MTQRERFEAWASDNGKWPEAIERSGQGYRLMQTQSDWTAWQAACPEGWQAVPIDPADDMMRAAWDLHLWDDESSVKLYRAMLSAAPKPGMHE